MHRSLAFAVFSACLAALSMLFGVSSAATTPHLPPPPVMPGSENVVITPRPLGNPARPVPARTTPAPRKTAARPASTVRATPKSTRTVKATKRAGKARTVKPKSKRVVRGTAASARRTTGS